MFLLVLAIGAIFGSIGSLMAFLITYDEYSHHYLSRREPLLAGLQTALFAFLVFMALSCLTGFLLAGMRPAPVPLP
ncbi:MAG: hypothetical protein IMW89_12215 [Ktedonobacteraceae bacterium]|nr:hypothetical protein [Ktedonobacteraceae bacterium]